MVSPFVNIGNSGAVKLTSSGKPYIPISSSSATSIYLTEFYTTDAATQHATLSLPEVCDSLISIPQPYTLALAESWIKLQLTGTSNLPLQVIRSGDPETGTFIGCVSLMPANSEVVKRIKESLGGEQGPEENECELGYYLHPDWRGKGIMRNSVSTLVSWGRETMGVGVVVRVQESNEESKAVIGSLEEFVRQEERDEEVEWPAIKGGGRRKVLVWKWQE